MKNSDDLESRLAKYLSFLKDKEKELKELEEDKSLDVDTKIRMMVKIINERMPE